MSAYAPLEGAEDVGRDSMQGAGETDRMVADGARGAELPLPSPQPIGADRTLLSLPAPGAPPRWALCASVPGREMYEVAGAALQSIRHVAESKWKGTDRRVVDNEELDRTAREGAEVAMGRCARCQPGRRPLRACSCPLSGDM